MASKCYICKLYQIIMKKFITLLSVALLFVATSCKSGSAADRQKSDPNVTRSVAVSFPENKQKTLGGAKPVSTIPAATAFRMSGDYADHVAISLDDQGNITYFPAPTDISPDSAPLALTDGWWLNRQGIGANSVFTKYTFSEYAALPQVPTVAQLKEAIIPDARVTEMITLPYSINEAGSHVSEINDFLLKVNQK